jgi:hypothetical protein
MRNVDFKHKKDKIFFYISRMLKNIVFNAGAVIVSFERNTHEERKIIGYFICKINPVNGKRFIKYSKKCGTSCCYKKCSCINAKIILGDTLFKKLNKLKASKKILTGIQVIDEQF